jgi:pantothenate kinase type III
MVRPQDGNINGLAVCDIGAYEYSAVNIPPTISNITDKTIDEDTATGSIAFTIGDMETPAASLIVTASSSNTTLVPNTNITLGGSGSSRTLNIKPGSNQSGTATITVTVDDDTDTTSDTFLLTVNSINDLPTISNITDKSTNENTTTSNIAFTIDDVETSATSLTVTATSSNTTLVPNTNITLGGSGTDRTINITPASNQYGTTTITVTVDDGTDTASDTFLLTVNSVNDLPTISNITDKTTNEDTATGNISFTVGDTETPATSLTVTATSSNTTLVPNANITLSGSGTDRTINITPASNQSGTATITVTVDDGTDTASDSFVLTVNELSTNSHQLFLPLILR